MTVPTIQDAAAQRGDRVEILQGAEARRQHEAGAKQKHARDQGEFIRLSRRHAQLARSLTADHQRERTSLEAPLMKLYASLHPRSIYKWDDDFVVIMRAERRA